MKQIINELALSVACLLDDRANGIKFKDLEHIQDLVTKLENLTSKPNDKTPDYYRLAARFYQFEDLPDNYLELEEDEFHSLLEENVWQSFEGHKGKNIALLIENLSEAMEKIARDTRKKTLDEVREALNIN